MKDFLRAELYALCQKMDSPIYVVGGAVRNYIMNLQTGLTDIDICGSFDIAKLQNDQSIKITSINKKLGTCQIALGEATFEYTRFRCESYNGGAHQPSSVEFHDSLEHDALRRDFTCNSIYYDVKNDKIIDPLGGIVDVKNKLIRTVSARTFEADGLRILRGVRFAAQLGFELERKTQQLLTQQAPLVMDISPDRKRDELERILHADSKYNVMYAHYNGLKLMQSCDIFPYILPEIKALEGVKQNPKYHRFDVLEHTLLAVKHARDDIRLAALMHDIGKPLSVDSEGHMKGHNVVSERLARIALGRGRLNYSNKIIEETARLCLLHMYDLKGETSDAKMKLFVAANYDIIDKLAALREADGKATGMTTNPKFNRFLHFKNQLIESNAPISLRDLKIRGEALQELGIEPARRSVLMQELLEICILDPRLNNESWLIGQLQRFSN